MNWLLLTFAFTFVASVVLTVIVRAVALRCQVVDHPDGKRKLHAGPVALWGGVGVYLALTLGLFVASLGTFGVDERFGELSLLLVVAAGIVCFCGAIDDCWALSSRMKLILQLVAVAPIVGFGYWIDKITVFGMPIELGWLGAPLTVLWLVGCINSLNLLDGMDGLASMVGALTAFMLAIIATSLGHDHVSVIALVLAGSLCGFLIHNRPPARVFLGDSGSMVIGLALGVLGMQGALKTSTTLAITVPAVIMSLPLLDTLLAIVRRKLTGRSFACADRQHIHHRLLDRGMKPWQALSLIGAICLTTGAAATAAAVLRTDLVAWITALALLVLVIRLRLFGHHELALASEWLARRLTRAGQRLVPIASAATAASLHALPLDEVWAALMERAGAFQPGRMELAIVEQGAYRQRYGWSAPQSGFGHSPWELTVKLQDASGRCCELHAAGAVDATLAAEPLMQLAGLLHDFAQHFLDRAGEPIAAADMTATAEFVRQKAA
jgi:UDP-GlcNAc:undecaprenyl-phosphate GlcNAc-1-phosphate transferase